MIIPTMLTIGLTASAIGLAQQENNARQATAPADPVEQLVKDQLKLSLDALDRISKMRQIGAPVNLSIEEYTLWSRRVLEAKLFLSLARDEKTQDVEVYLRAARGGPVSERVGFFEEHLTRMRYVEAQNRVLVDRQQISTLDFLNVEFNRRQAEVWLARERGRAAR